MDSVKLGEPSSRPDLGSIPLYLINGVATVWDAQTAATLHCEHDISGLRAGTLPGVSQQNGFLGLPITLMQEETAYLVRSGIAHLIPVPSPSVPPASLVAERTAARVQRAAEVAAKARAEEAVREAERRRAFEAGGDKARAKREARAKARAAKVATGVEGDSGLLQDTEAKIVPPPVLMTEVSTTGSSVIHQEASEVDATSVPPSATSNAFHAVPAVPIRPLPCSDPITTLPHPLFPFPSTPRHAALLGVFTALQREGYRLGLGPRFGGEYLIYPGDYLRYHAHFTSQVLVRDEVVRPSEIVAWGRLGTGTKKAGLLCCWDDGVRSVKSKQGEGEEGEAEEIREKDGQVEFYSLEWASFG